MKIFIASSSRSNLLAESLQSELESAAQRAGMTLDVVAWFREGSFAPGDDTLNTLINHCSGASGTPSDFCAVLLTKDDEVNKKGEKGSAPRDNCIFELGLFMGALGLDPKRCFMISSVGEHSLPSDLKGRTLITFEEPADVSDPEQCRRAMVQPATRIRDRVRACGRYIAPDLAPRSIEELMALETSENDGVLLESSHVMVGIEHSFAGECKRARQILRNLKSGIKYSYFVPNLEPSNDIARLIQTLAKTGASNEPKDSEANRQLVLENLTLLQNGLSVNLSPGQVPFGFRIQNAFDPERSIYYARQPNQGKYYDWARYRDAVEMARVLQGMCLHDEDLDPVFVIRPTRFLDLKLPEGVHYLQRIKRSVAQGFAPELQVAAERICFGTSSVPLAAGATH